MQASENQSVEPWLRSSRRDVPVVARAALHAIDLAREDFERWVWSMAPDQYEQTPFGLPSIAFQARHVARSLDRLLTYAEGNVLTEAQASALRDEHTPAPADATHTEFLTTLREAEQRILRLASAPLQAERFVGRARIPVTLGALLVHIADHTQRHAGQAVTTAKVLRGLQLEQQS